MDFWEAIDLLAAESGLSASAFARAAGLDATALNPSKRQGLDGKARWPKVDTLLLLLNAAGVSLSAFSDMLERVSSRRSLTGVKKSSGRAAPPSPGQFLRMVPFSQLSQPGLFDRASLPSGKIRSSGGKTGGHRSAGGVWQEIASPTTHRGPHDYAVRLDTAEYEPVFRIGGLLILAPDAAIREQDRVLHRVTAGKGGAGRAKIVVVEARNRASLTLRSLVSNGPDYVTVDLDDPGQVLHRIVMGSV